MKFPTKPFYCSLFLFFAIASFTGCSDIIEPSIANKQIQAEAPANTYQSASYTVNFWWDGVDNALKYHLQVVTPKFDSVASLVLDTVVKSTRFSFSFSPGKYQWRVRAENGSSQTPYSAARSFTIFPSSIKQQQVQLSGPANNLLTNQSNIIFGWNSIYGATKYQLEIDTNNFVNESSLVYNQTTPSQQINFTLSKDQTYQWRVRAENDTAQSQWSSIYYFSYDHTPPAVVSLTAPANAQTVSLPITLQWSPVTSAVKYKLYVYQSDSTTLFSSAFPMTLTTTSYSFNQGSSGTKLYWKVTAVDAVGNESSSGNLRYFQIQ